MAAADKNRRPARRRGIPPEPPPRADFSALAPGDDALALALWQCRRNVLAWARTPEERRPALFRRVTETVRRRMGAAADAAPALGDALAVLLELQEAPGAATAERVGRACHLVWEWAERRGLTDVAAHYAEAAAYAEPTDPGRAVIAGHAARKAGGAEMRARSGVWYVRARALAVRAGARFEVIRAITGYGALLKDMGRVDEALVQYEDAARRAGKRYRRRCAVAKHYIFALHVDRGRFEEAVPYAVEAFDLYPARDERLPFLAHDLAYVLVRMRYHRLALHLLDATAAGMTRPHEMGLLFGTTAEAAGGARRPARYLAAERAALELVAKTGEHAGAALASLAEGARSLADWERAELHARESLAVALRHGDARQAEESRALLRAVLAREPAPPAATPPDDAPVAMLARRFAAHLRRASRRGTRL